MICSRRIAGSRVRGFTLIELLVVVAIILVIVGLAGVQLMRGPGDIVREESEHLALLLRTAHEEAILQGRVYAFGAGRETYRFLRLGRDGRLKETVEDDILRPRRLRAGVRIEAVRIEGASDADGGGLVFLPSGELPVFQIVVGGDGVTWTVFGGPDGTILAKADS